MRSRKLMVQGVGIVEMAALVMAMSCGPGPDKQPLVWGSIHEAASRGDLADVKRHLARGVAVNAEDEDGWTPLHFAVKEGHKEVTEYLLSKGADIGPTRGVGSWTPLHTAAYEGQREVAELLIAKGANVDARNGNNSTPLHYACSQGHKDVVELLIARGADVNAEDRNHGTPLIFARHNGGADIAELLRRHGAKEAKE